MKITRRRGRLAVVIGVLATSSTVADLSAQTMIRGEVGEVESGLLLEGAEVRLSSPEGVPAATTTSQNTGLFEVRLNEGGRYTVHVSRFGYLPVEGSVEIEDGETLSVLVRLSPDVVSLEAVTVVADREEEWGRLRRFRERAQRVRRFGGGRIYLTDDIEAMRVPSIRRLIDAHSWGPRCRPSVYLNGLRIEEDWLFGVTNNQVLGLELYREDDSMPAEYHEPGTCGMALVWTRNESPDRGWSWSRLGVAGVIVLVVGFVLR